MSSILHRCFMYFIFNNERKRTTDAVAKDKIFAFKTFRSEKQSVLFYRILEKKILLLAETRLIILLLALLNNLEKNSTLLIAARSRVSASCDTIRSMKATAGGALVGSSQLFHKNHFAEEKNA